jgi:cell shape-determining protein MreC
LSILLIPAVVVVILVDKPDSHFFNFVYRNMVPIAQMVGQGATYPVRLVRRAVGSVRKSRTVIKENQEMMAELEDMRRVMVENDALQKENGLLREKLGIAENMKYKVVVSGIIHDNSFAGRQSFIIRNPNGGIASGNVAVSNAGFLLGIIDGDIGHYARIMSVRDAGSNIPVKVAGTDVFGFLQGAGGGDPELRFLSDGDFVPEHGMFLITSGVNGNIPSGIPVGRIEEVKGSEIKIGLGADIGKQENVMILLFGKDGKY